MNLISLTFNTDPEGSSLTVCHPKIKYFCCWLLKSIIISQDLAERITQSERQWALRERVSRCIKWDWFSMCRNKRSGKDKKKKRAKSFLWYIENVHKSILLFLNVRICYNRGQSGKVMERHCYKTHSCLLKVALPLSLNPSVFPATHSIFG